MIRILEKEVADKIAAGEVVDRPLSIVKELVENSIDAGAGAITVEVQKGGKTYIRVTDDGCGIPEEQVEKAFLRHATSKIACAGDLAHIKTLGFRGEALASIAAVTRTEVITKTRNSKTGIRLAIEGSQPVQREHTGCPDGTTIVVRDLFYNTPARQKFMKSDAAESAMVIEFLSQMALAYADIRIRVMNNGNLLFSTPGKGDRYKNILTVYSVQMGGELIPLRAEKDNLLLEGYISGPGQSRATRKNQIFFINGRAVDSKVFQKSIDQAYSDKLFEGRHPMAFLFLQAQPESLDVNIHPNKREVRFNDEPFVMEFVSQALRKALLSKESIPPITKNTFRQKMPAPQSPEQSFAPNASKAVLRESQVDIKSLLSTIRQEEDLKSPGLREEPAVYTEKPRGSEPLPRTAQPALPGTETPAPFDFDQLTITGSIFGTYITGMDEDCLYLIDQHAAHERVLFEKLMRQYQDADKHCQSILTPLTLNVAYDVSEGGDNWSRILIRMGFSIEPFGPKTYIVKGIPAFMGVGEADQFLSDFSDNIGGDITPDNIPVMEKLIMRSCKSAVKARDYLKDSEIRQLIDDLAKCENPFSCPHGRPTFIKLTQHEIEKMFKRV